MSPKVTDAMFLQSLNYVRSEVFTAEFWDYYHQQLVHYSLCYPGLLESIRMAWKGEVPEANKSGLKLFSHFGAVRAHADIMGTVYDSTGHTWFDAENALYKWAMRAIWPGCLKNMDNEKTIGDVLESFLGLCWFALQKSRVPGHSTSNIPLLIFHEHLERVLQYIYDHWDQSEKKMRLQKFFFLI